MEHPNRKISHYNPKQGSVPLASRSSAGNWQGKVSFWSFECFYRIHAGSWQQLQIIKELSTQREQLWAVDTAAGGEGATLQAMAATGRPTQREQLWAVGTTAGGEGATLLSHWHFNNHVMGVLVSWE